MKLNSNLKSFRADSSRTISRRTRSTVGRTLKYFVSGFVLLACFANVSYADEFTLKVIAINDFHGNLLPPGHQADSRLGDMAAGGVDVLAGYVRDLKAQNQSNVVVAAGDLIGASPFVSAFFHDEPTIETLNQLGLEISTVGNHEFDRGPTELKRMQSGGCSVIDKNTCQGIQAGTFQGAKFQYLAANVLDRATGKTILPAYLIKMYNGVPIAFIGVTLKETPVWASRACVANLRFLDEARTINAIVRKLRGQGVQSSIVLIHQGGEQSEVKATDDINACEGGLKGSAIERIVNQLNDGVDLVVSGHSHAAYICRVTNKRGRKIPVTSAASNGLVVTSADLTIDTATRKITKVEAVNEIVREAGTAADAEIQAAVTHYVNLAETSGSKVVGTVSGDIKKATKGESALGDLIADAQLEYTRESRKAEMAFMNPGGIRKDLNRPSGIKGIPDGQVTYSQLWSIQPFGNDLVTMTLRGEQIRRVLEAQFKNCTRYFPPKENAARDQEVILQVSRDFTYTYNSAGKPCHKVNIKSMKLGNKPITLTKTYRVTVNSFLAGGGDKFYEFTRGTERVGEAQACLGRGEDLQALIAFFNKHQPVSANQQKRINVSQEPNH